MLTISRALSKCELEFYVRWLEYIPNFWDFNRILEKKVKNLTPEELKKLLEINNDKKEALFIKKIIEQLDSKCKNKNGRMIINISIDDNEKLSNIIKRFTVDEVVKSKVSEEEKEIINNCSCKEDLSKIDNAYVLEYAKMVIKKKESIDNKIDEPASKELKKVIGQNN